LDAVFPYAANVSHWSANNAQQTLDNVAGTRNMVATALRRKARRFIHISSIAAFGFQAFYAYAEWKNLVLLDHWNGDLKRKCQPSLNPFL